MSIIATDMKNIAIANGLTLSPYAFEKIYEDKNSLQLVHEYALSLPGVEKVILLLPEDSRSSPGFIVDRQKKRAVGDLLIRIQALSEGYENIFYFYADCPLLDSELSKRMFQNHQKYFADYTFADGYPYGLSPEIIKPSIIKPLLNLAGEEGKGVNNALTASSHNEVTRSSLFDLIKKDINAFDIETEISPTDLRLLRVTLSADSKRNFMLLKRVVNHGGRISETICRIFQDKAEILRTLPSFFSIQIVEGCPQLCSYCPYPVFSIKTTGKKGEMPLNDFENILNNIEDLCEDAVINISLWGEPSYHSHISEIVQAALDRRGFRLIIETSGIGWDSKVFTEIAKSNKKSLDWVVSLDANKPEMYQHLRGPGFEEVQKTIEALLACFPEHVYIQAVRMKDNEEELEEFYRQWKKKSDHVIIQKYDSFCGFLPDRKVTDLSPLKRFPCWHIKRDVNILIDGRIPLCREDIGCQYVLGNLFSDDLEQVWARGEKYYLDHLKGCYPELCKKCDEYYTFNF